jgi:branched-chain amino acid transport system substrate-binding protein
MTSNIRKAAALLLAGTIGLFSHQALADNGPGVTDNSVLVCAYQPETGTESSYFRMGKGADAWFKYVNDHGGVNGRKIDFKMVDDSYQPARTVAIVKRFVEADNCFAIVAALGSAPTAAVIDYIVGQKVPLVGAGTGAAKNVYVKSRYVFPLYPPYDFEGKELVRFVKEVFKVDNVAVLYQNDPSGKSEMAGITDGETAYGVKVVASESYDPTEIDVSSQVLKMKDSGAKSVICACAPEFAARFLTERAKLGWTAPVINVFFGKSPKVAELAGNQAVEGVYFTTIFREFDDSAPAIQLAKEILHKYYPEEQPDAIHLWGFTSAEVFTEALKRMGRDNITRERLLDTLEGINNWDGSVVPVVNINKMADGDSAIKHLLVPGMSFVVFKDGKFQPFQVPWSK